MKGIILAAGRGSRMGERTKELPKGMTQLYGKTLIEHQMEKMKEAGLNSIAVVRGYKAEKIDFAGLEFFDNLRWNESNMVRSLTCAADALASETCIISYSDIYYHAEAISLLMNCEADIAITYNTNWYSLWSERFENPLDDAETFEIDEHHIVREIGKRAKDLSQIQGQYMGLLRFTPAGWKKIKAYLDQVGDQAVDKLDMTSLLSALIEQGIEIVGIPYDGVWLEIDSESDLKLYEERAIR